MNRYKYTHDFARPSYVSSYKKGDRFVHLVNTSDTINHIHINLMSQKMDGSWKIHILETGFFEYIRRACGLDMTGDITESFLNDHCQKLPYE